jgi:membrane fusion protein
LARRSRLEGEILVLAPPRWHLFGGLLLGIAAAAGVALATGSYARVVTVPGVIVPDRGVAPIVALRAGHLETLLVRDGDMVRAGQPLARVTSDSYLQDGSAASDRIVDSIAQRDTQLRQQMEAASRVAAAQLERIRVQQSGLSAELQSITEQIRLQEELVRSAVADFERAREVAERGFVSRRELASREELVMTRRQQLAQLQQSRDSRLAAMRAADRELAEVSAQQQQALASLGAVRAEVAGQRTSAEAGGAQTLVAPFAGRVTALTARAGQPVGASAQLMQLVPSDARLHVELQIPSEAIGFVDVGQSVRIAVDAFPYQRFGVLDGTVTRVALSGTAVQADGGRTAAVWPVEVKLDEQSIPAFGREQPLLPGMTVTARVQTARRSLFEWLFEPLFAVGRR